ncbi:MAG: hypothetical protein K2J36_00580 [Ruminococcus sp.]|nr:hypothetical protein [Ruminococcus sp.]MDE6796499.1 hypothetical protein [Ruminococcus sp.]
MNGYSRWCFNWIGGKKPKVRFELANYRVDVYYDTAKYIFHTFIWDTFTGEYIRHYVSKKGVTELGERKEISDFYY